MRDYNEKKQLKPWRKKFIVSVLVIAFISIVYLLLNLLYTLSNEINDFKDHRFYGSLNLDFIVKRQFDDSYSFDDAINPLIYDEKIFLLSAHLGEGKTATFQSFWFRLKEKYPEKLVLYIDSKKQTYSYKALENIHEASIEQLATYLSEDLFKLKGREENFFNKCFKTDSVIFLWDAVDEIVPQYKDILIDMIDAIKKQTGNIQFIAIRPQNENFISYKIFTKAIKFAPMTDLEGLEFVIKFTLVKNKYFMDVDLLHRYENINKTFVKDFKESSNKKTELLVKSLGITSAEASRCYETIKAALEILNTIEQSAKENFSPNPLIIRMIVETAYKGNNQKYDNLSVLYRTLVDGKMEIAHEEYKKAYGVRIPEEKLKVIFENFQGYAITLIKELYCNELELKGVSIVSNTRSAFYDEISSYGIILAITDKDYSFIHRSLAEYFAATYLFENLSINNEKDMTTQFKLKLFNCVMLSQKFTMVRNFMISFGKEANIKGYFHNQNEKIKEISEKVISENLLTFLRYAEYWAFFMQNKVDLNHYLGDDDALHLKASDLMELEANFEEVIKYFDKHDLFNAKTNDGRTLLHQIMENSRGNVFNNFLDKIKLNFNKATIHSLLLVKDVNNQTALAFAAKSQDYQNMIKLKKFIKNSDSSFNELDDDNLQTGYAVKSAMANKYPRVLNFIVAFYRELNDEDDEKMREILLDHNEEKTSFIYDAIVYGSIESCKNVAKFLDEIFDTQDLKTIFNFKNEEGKTVFEELKYQDDVLEKLKIFQKLKDG